MSAQYRQDKKKWIRRFDRAFSNANSHRERREIVYYFGDKAIKIEDREKIRRRDKIKRFRELCRRVRRIEFQELRRIALKI